MIKADFASFNCSNNYYDSPRKHKRKHGAIIKYLYCSCPEICLTRNQGCGLTDRSLFLAVIRTLIYNNRFSILDKQAGYRHSGDD